MLSVASLFSGIGGICRAFIDNDFDVKWANDYDKSACKTYRNNFKHLLYDEDISNLTKADRIKELEYVDVITSGFPCQAFSIAGYQKGFQDPRGNLFFETAKIIDKLKPRAYLLENVKNLVTHDGKRTFSKIKNTIIEDLKYSFIPFVLNSKDYGNIPQNRERIYMVGFRNESDFQPFDGTFDVYNINKEGVYRDYVDSFLYDKKRNFVVPEPIKLTKTIHDIILKDKQEDIYYYNQNQLYYEKLSESVTSKDTIYQWRRIYVRDNKNNVCPTLTANMGTGGHNVPIIKDNYGFRKLTPKECLGFQGFPSDFAFPNIPNSHKYKQIGNSVTVPVISRIAKEIKRVLEQRGENV